MQVDKVKRGKFIHLDAQAEADIAGIMKSQGGSRSNAVRLALRRLAAKTGVPLVGEQPKVGGR